MSALPTIKGNAMNEISLFIGNGSQSIKVASRVDGKWSSDVPGLADMLADTPNPSTIELEIDEDE